MNRPMMKAAARHPLGLLRVVSGAPAGVCRGRRREAMDASGIAPSHICLLIDVMEQVLSSLGQLADALSYSCGWMGVPAGPHAHQYL